MLEKGWIRESVKGPLATYQEITPCPCKGTEARLQMDKKWEVGNRGNNVYHSFEKFCEE